MNKTKHTTYYVCDSISDKYGMDAICCRCTGHKCNDPIAEYECLWKVCPTGLELKPKLKELLKKSISKAVKAEREKFKIIQVLGDNHKLIGLGNDGKVYLWESIHTEATKTSAEHIFEGWIEKRGRDYDLNKKLKQLNIKE